MSEDKNMPAADDLDVESSEAASVAGGRMAQFESNQGIEMEMFRLESEGYVAAGCTTEGTVMVNPKTRHKVTVKTVI